VRKALQLMEADRLVVRHQGRGTFVSDPSSDELVGRFSKLYGPDGVRVRGQVKSVEIARQVASDAERARLRLPAGADVFRVRRVQYHNGAAFLVEEAALPAELFPHLEGQNGIADQITAMASKYGILPGNAEERVSNAVPPHAVAQTLQTASDTPVVVLDRVVFTFDNRRPVEWRVAHSHLPGSYYLAEFR
jgi:GntR family transcriptional regulator